MNVRVYIEGGGGAAADILLRQGFEQLFAKVIPGGRKPKLIPGGTRRKTFDLFRWRVRDHPDESVLLLVDSEEPIRQGVRPKQHLKENDHWDMPEGVTDEQIHLMVQCMEAWFVADREALVAYYGEGFRAGSLPARANVEEIARADVLKGLRNATSKARPKGRYQKVEHGSDLLARIDPNKVRRASRHARELFDTLLRLTR